MNPTTESLKARTRQFALDVLTLVEQLSPHGPADAVGRQLTRSGTSVGANYRSACRARSRAEFAAKIGIVLEEADESMFWLELIDQRQFAPREARSLVGRLLNEAGELTAIFAASSITARRPKSST